jgi:preprotein translocase subunit SecA
VHLVTVNDYWRNVMIVPGKHHYLNFMVYDGVLTHQPTLKEEKAYDADITYGTNNEFGFDYLEITWHITS